MDSDGDEEESKQQQNGKANSKGKKNGKHRREPLEKGEWKSKGAVAESKLANKRSQKDALKKNKIKRNKGTIKDGADAKPNGKAAA